MRFLLLLFLATIIGRCGAAPIETPPNFYSQWVKFLPTQPMGGWYTGTLVNSDTPPREYRGTFAGIDYDNPPHQIFTTRELEEYHSCSGEYARCLLRIAQPYVVCAYDTWARSIYKFHSICEIEYANCVNTERNTGRIYGSDYTWHRFVYDGEGWWRWHDAWIGGGWWICAEQDLQYYNGWRRSLSNLAAPLTALFKAPPSPPKPHPSNTS